MKTRKVQFINIFLGYKLVVLNSDFKICQFSILICFRHYLLSLSGLAVENTAGSTAVAEETLSKLVTSVLKLEADCLGVEVLASEQGRAIDGGSSV